jgi:hypothetical protein
MKVHPLYLMVGFPPTFMLEKVMGVPPERAVRWVTAFFAGCWVATAFVALRACGSRWLDAVVLTGLLCTSGAAIVWSAVPETYLPGSISILIPLIVLAVSKRYTLGFWTYVATSAASLSITITNWMSGLAMAFLRLPRRAALRVSIYAFYAVVTVWGVQQAVFKDTPFFLDPFIERHVALRHEWGGPTRNLTSMLFSGMVLPQYTTLGMPAVPALNQPPREDYQIMTMQLSSPGSAGVTGRVGVVLWAGLLIAGVAALALVRDDADLRLMLAAVLLGQIALHTVYGEESFLYSLHHMPLFLLLVAWGARTRLRPLVLSAAAVLAILAAYNNLSEFREIGDAIRAHCDRHESDPVPEQF